MVLNPTKYHWIYLGKNSDIDKFVFKKAMKK